MSTTVQIDVEEKSRLDKLKVHPRETYGEVIHRAIDALENVGDEVDREIESRRQRGKRE